MMDSVTKRRHECIKRFLIFNSGKKLKNPIHSCFVRNFRLEDNNCRSNSNSEERAFNGNNDSQCYGCTFSKCFYYFSDALKFYKSMLVIAVSEENFAREGYSMLYDWVRSDAIELLRNMLASTQSMCYLTFKDKDKRDLTEYIMDIQPNEFIKLLSDMCDFCNENNIK